VLAAIVRKTSIHFHDEKIVKVDVFNYIIIDHACQLMTISKPISITIVSGF
jgi:hypothetical protein